MTIAIDILPKPGEIVRVRSRRYLVEDVTEASTPGDQTLVRFSCLEDDAEGKPLEVLWEKELDARRMNEADWSKLARGQFDPLRWFTAYLQDAPLELRHIDRPTIVSVTVQSWNSADAYQ